MVHRNQLRLLKLVNALLDFSRIESGRAQATYRPTDISALTRELAGAFRSAIEHAGLRFDVDCPPIAAPVYVDRDMWEKVVLNLLSNALKFTLEGSIRIAIARARRPHRADRPGHRRRHSGDARRSRVRALPPGRRRPVAHARRVRDRPRAHARGRAAARRRHHRLESDTAPAPRLRSGSRLAARIFRRTGWPSSPGPRRRRGGGGVRGRGDALAGAGRTSRLRRTPALARPDPGRGRQRRHARLPASAARAGWDVETVGNGAAALDARAHVAAGPGRYRRDDARARWLRTVVGAAGRSADAAPSRC